MTQPSDGVQGPVRPWSRAVVSVLLAIGLAVVATPVMVAHAHSPSPGTSAPQAISVIAKGPFGSVAGRSLPVDAPLPDPGTLEALDAYGRGASIAFSPTEGSFDHWRSTVSREPSLDPAAADELDTGDSAASAAIRLRSSGLFLVRLDGVVIDPSRSDDPGTAGSWVWRIAVPDRDVPDGGEPYPPMPAIILASGDRSVALDPGSGCFIGTCGDIGATSPPGTLPTIRTLAGAPLSARLSDGSGIAAWSADATPVGGTDHQTVPLGAGEGDPATHSVMFAAPPRGRWVILVHVRFDRDRGSADGYGRLILAPAAQAHIVDRVGGPG